MPVGFPAASLCLALLLFLAGSPVQKQESKITLNGNSIERFYQAADHHSDTLLLRTLQFTAPYPGFYQALSLDSNGRAFTARIVPDWAIQASKTANLESDRQEQIRQMLVHLTIASCPSPPEPQPGELRTALVFYNGKTFERHDFNGSLPGQVQDILDIVRTELEKAEKARYEEFLRHHDLMEETYGDWQTKPGVVLVTDCRTRGLKPTRGLLLTLSGKRNEVPPAAPALVSIYSALVFYPDGPITGIGCGGSSDDPLSSWGVTWTLPKGSGADAAGTEKGTLEIKYHAIDGTVTVAGTAYQLAQGNMFVIRMTEDWTPIVRQIEARRDEQTTEEKVLDHFKSILRDDVSIQQLELN